MAEPNVAQDVWVNTNMDRTKWLRGDPETGGWFTYNPSTGAYDTPLGVNAHLHPTLGDINFTGSISATGDAGITGEYEGTFKKIIIKNGIITEFELV